MNHRGQVHRPERVNQRTEVNLSPMILNKK